ncbi:QacE family quaternary ammonium compound efflux SMR transporter [Mycolicibacterium sp. P9-64]|uniref:DMT family transporter n=1 Tax=Mycolicibacterium sp. P9-64 TaxID=2024612 RepID=UPI0011EE5868|nr:SMR family transporter [Mycolicibacterium sp. P9-64]KAA0084572.1 QacE family quaternary ammonium compound efflux SMR transporter [Mycolicibacterium sp. P9-64]
MNKWALLTAAILTEVVATLSLRASQDHPGWYAVVAVGYVMSFVLVMRVLRAGIPIGVTYGIWGACGTALIAVSAAMIFGDPFTWPIVVGIGFIVLGVILVEFGLHAAEGDQKAAVAGPSA